jgi:hypothetical protein
MVCHTGKENIIALEGLISPTRAGCGANAKL